MGKSSSEMRTSNRPPGRFFSEMTMTLRMSLQGLAILFLALSVSVKASAEELRVGGLFDLTSAAGGIWGRDELKGTELAIKEYHADPSRKFDVKLIVEDAAYSSTKSVTGFQKLTNLDKAKIVIGPTWEVFEATGPICERTKIICLSPSNYGAYFHSPSAPLRYSFTAFYDERGYGAVLAEELNRIGATQVAHVSAISPYFETVDSALRNGLKEPLISSHQIASDTKDFKSTIVRLPKEISALVLILDGGTQMLEQFLSQWRQLRPDRPTIYTHDGILYEANWATLQNNGFHYVLSSPLIEPESEKRWNEKFEMQFGQKPESPSAAIAYDLAKIALSCADEVGATDVEKIRHCIAHTQNYLGASGTLSFNGNQTVDSREFKLMRFPEVAPSL